MRSILQTTEWAEFKKTQGFEILNLDEIFIHKRQIFFGQNFLYLPEVSSDDISPLQVEQLKKITEQNSIFSRLELINPFSESSHKLILSMGFIKAFEEVQPKWRQIINLMPPEAEILADMKPKGRYNIRLAERHQVKIQKSNLKVQNEEEIKKQVRTFCELYNQTVQREKISGRSEDYFRQMVDKFKGSDYLEIYIATYENEPVAAAIISFYDHLASYLYGGSSRRHKEVMAPYLLHWQVMCDAKERGCQKYDLIGRSAPETEDKWSGVTRFKEQFGGDAMEILGSYDYVSKLTWYQIFKTIEKFRRK